MVTQMCLILIGTQPYNIGGGCRDIFYQISKGEHLRFWTFSKTNFGPFSKGRGLDLSDI